MSDLRENPRRSDRQPVRAAVAARGVRALQAGCDSEQELDRAKDEAIRNIVAKQAAIGLPVVTDGELRRRNFQESFGSSVSGFEVATEDRAMEGVNTAPLSRAEQNFSAPGPAIVTRRKVVERLALTRNVPLSEYKFASALTDRR